MRNSYLPTHLMPEFRAALAERNRRQLLRDACSRALIEAEQSGDAEWIACERARLAAADADLKRLPA